MRAQQYVTVHCITDINWDGRMPIRANGMRLTPYLVTKGCDKGSQVAIIYKQLKDIRGMGERRLTVGKDITQEEYDTMMSHYQLPIISNYLKSDQCAAMVEKMLELGRIDET